MEAVSTTVSIPRGCIIMWSGSVNLIPDGWALCDGSNGTPNLGGKFALGVDEKSYFPGSTGGSASVTLTIDQIPNHSHPVTDPGHNHSITTTNKSGSGYCDNTESGDTSTAYTNSSHTGITIGAVGGGTAHNNMPPYYALCYIMKL